jgi:hypothetical protein
VQNDLATFCALPVSIHCDLVVLAEASHALLSPAKAFRRMDPEPIENRCDVPIRLKPCEIADQLFCFNAGRLNDRGLWVTQT